MTATVDVSANRTQAATEARRLAKSERLCRELVTRLDTMPNALLAALWTEVAAEVNRRRP